MLLRRVLCNASYSTPVTSKVSTWLWYSTISSAGNRNWRWQAAPSFLGQYMCCFYVLEGTDHAKLAVLPFPLCYLTNNVLHLIPIHSRWNWRGAAFPTCPRWHRIRGGGASGSRRMQVDWPPPLRRGRKGGIETRLKLSPKLTGSLVKYMGSLCSGTAACVLPHLPSWTLHATPLAVFRIARDVNCIRR